MGDPRVSIETHSDPAPGDDSGAAPDRRWIPIGTGGTVADLKKVVRELKQKWRSRYDYRIKAQPDPREPYQLCVKHRG